MPVDETIDINLEATTSNLDKLDRDSKKAARALEKQRKALEKAQKIREQGGVFGQATVPGGGGAPKDIARLSKRDQRIERKLRKIEDKIAKDQAKQLGNKSSFLEDLLGKRTAKNIFAMGKNPKGFIFGIAKALPFLGGVFAAKEIVDFIIGELVKLDEFLKIFLDIADARENRTRTLELQAQFQAGLQGQILTTSSGSVNPQESFNSFLEFNKNQGEIEGKYALQNTSGVP